MVEPMRDWLADVDRNRQHSEPGPKVCDDFGFRARTGLEIDLDFGGVNALRMLVEFSAAGSPADSLDFGDLKNEPLSNQTDPMRFQRAKCPG